MDYTSKDIKVPVQNEGMDGTLYVPESNDKLLPGVVIFHGRGSQKLRYTDRAEALAEAGFITLVFSFRGCGESDGNFANQTPVMGLEDAKAGFDFLVSREKIDKKRIGVWGGSFGGYMAAILTQERDFDSLMLAAPALYKDEWWETVLESLEGETQKYREGNDFSNNKAIKAIQDYQGSLMLLRHEQDDVCPTLQTKTFLENAKKAKLTEEVEIKGLGHRLVEMDHRKESNKITVDWFKKTL